MIQKTSVIVPGKTKHINPAYNNQLKFGCRVFAYMTPETYTDQDRFLKQWLRDGGNSMEAQNQLPFKEPGNTGKPAQPNFRETEEPDIRKVGWGLTAFAENEKAPFTQKDAQPIWSNPVRYHSLVDEIAAKKPQVVLGHLREDYLTGENGEKNNHPFQFNDWSLIQHGNIPEQTQKKLQKALEQLAQQTGHSKLLPKGTTDSEKVAAYLAASLAWITPDQSMNMRTLDTSTLREHVRTELSDMIISNQPLEDSKQCLGYPGTFNIVISDGQRLMASRYSEGNPLYMGTHLTPDGKAECLFATAPMQPLPKTGLNNIHWREIPHNTFITVERQTKENGKTKLVATEQPLLQLTNPKDSTAREHIRQIDIEQEALKHPEKPTIPSKKTSQPKKSPMNWIQKLKQQAQNAIQALQRVVQAVYRFLFSSSTQA